MASSRLAGVSLLIALLATAYTLTNAGFLHIIDEASRFALTESLVQRRAIDTNAIAWSQWVTTPKEAQGAFGPSGDVYSKKGPAQPFLAVPWYLGLQLLTRLGFPAGLLQGAFLFNGLVTALTAGLLWLTAVRLGYSDRKGLILGLIYGLSTIAWPYANYYLGEPLSALSLLAVFYSLLVWRRHQEARAGRGKNRICPMLWLSGIAAGVTVATVAVHALLIAVLGLYWLTHAYRFSRQSSSSRQTTYLHFISQAVQPAIPLLVTAALLAWYNVARFGSPLDTGYTIGSGESFSTPILRGFWGLLFSPYRGLLWYTPLCLASLVAFPAFLRRHRAEGLVIAGLSIVLIGLYSKWWMWWAGYAWGPRFLVPLIPFWVLLLAPLLHLPAAKNRQIGSPKARRFAWINRQSLGLWLGLGGLTLLSSLVQIGAVSVNFVNYETELRQIYPTDWLDPLRYGPPAQSLWDLANSPVFGQWRLMARGIVTSSDLAWLWPNGKVLWPIVLLGGLLLVGLSLALARWCLVLRPPVATRRWRATVFYWLSPLLPLILMVVWLQQVSASPIYGTPGQGYRAILAEIAQEVQPGDVMVTVAPYHYHIPMNWMGGLYWVRIESGNLAGSFGLPIVGHAADSMAHPETQQILSRLLQQSQRIWYVTAGFPPADPSNTTERWLADNAYKAEERWYDDFRLLRYGTDAEFQRTAIASSAMDLPLMDQSNQVTLSAVWPAEIPPGKLLPVRMTFRLASPASHDLRWFVQLWDVDGNPIVQLDTAPVDGYQAFSAIPIDESREERVGLQLPPDLAVGRYRLIAGLYNPAIDGDPRLRTPDGHDFVELGYVSVR